MRDLRATVSSVEPHPLPYFTLHLEIAEDFLPVVPGQFVMVEVGERLEPYLRRPFSVHDLRVAGSRVEIDLLGKVIGRGTHLLSTASPGSILRVLGPLGRGFEVQPHDRVALVAGGVGSAALLLLGRQLADRRIPFDFYYGGRSSIDLPCRSDFEEAATASGGSCIVTTEDGSEGREGLVTGPLGEALEQGAYGFLYACGPMGLLAALAGLARDHGVAGEAALEAPMGCGYGACLGCAVPHVDGHFALCCKDGPVFRFDEVRW